MTAPSGSPESEIGAVAAEAARRLRRRSASYRRLSEESLAKRFRDLLKELLADGGSGRGRSRWGQARGGVAAWTGPGVDACDLLAAFAELRRGLHACACESDGARCPAALEEAAYAWLEAAAERLEQARGECLSATLRALPQTVLVIDGEGVVCYAHSRLRAELGLASAQLVGLSLEATLTPDLRRLFTDPDSVARALAEIAAAPRQAHEFVLPLHDGDALLLRSLPVSEHGHGASLVVVSVHALEALAAKAARARPAWAGASQAESDLVHSVADALAALRRLDALSSTVEREVERLPAPESPVASTGAAASVLLSRREHEVLRLLAEGLTSQEVGKRLFISPHTARVHVRRLMQKLDAKTRAEAVAIGFHQSLLP